MRWLVRLFVNDADRRTIEADLAELHEVRRRLDGDRAAARWLRRQRLLYPLHLIGDRFRTSLSEGMATMPHVWRDLSYGLRHLARAPALTAAIVLTVGVALGATTAMVGVVRSVLVAPLPYAAPDELVWIFTDNAPYRFRFSVVDYRALEDDHPALSAVAAYQTRAVTVREGTLSERITSRSVTGSYFPLLGQTPHLGRLFDDGDDRRTDNVAVLTHSYWIERFGGARSVLGRTVTLDGDAYTIVGVLARADGPLESGVSLFTAARWPAPRRKGPFFTTAIGRVRTDVPRAAVVAALQATNRRLFPIWKSSYQDEKATWGIQDLKERTIGTVGARLYLVLAAVGCLLLIACANAVNLLIARALGRRREFAIRTALGASTARLIQHQLVETAVLTSAAAVIGLGIAMLGLRLVTTYGAGYIPRLDEVRLSAPVLGWLAALAAGSGLVILGGSLVPALAGAATALRSGGRSATDGPGARRARRTLVAIEFALATPLIVAAVLVALSLDRLSRVPVGIDVAHLLTASVSLPDTQYAKEAERKAFWDRTLVRLAALPGVEAVALADSRPPREAGQTNNFDLEDRPTPPGQNQPLSTWVGVSPGFFQAVGLTLERGRLLDERSLQDDVVVVDRAWAERFFPGERVLGRRLKNGGCTECPWTTVVGVVDTVKWVGLDAPDRGTVYFPFVDLPTAFVVLRTTAAPSTQATALQQVMRELDPALAVSRVATGEDLLSTSLAAPRYLSVLVGGFAIAALVLSVVGIYGVMAYFIQQHRREIGIRLALGGEPSDVRRLVVFQGLRLVAIGVGVGIGGALLTSRSLPAVLFGVSPTDLPTLVGVPLALVTIAALACLAPGRRAGRLDPAEVLREG